MALIVMHVADTLAHRKPTLRLGTVPMPTFPVNLERSGLIDDGFHAQHQTQLVVHLQPVLAHVMFDACSGLTYRLVMGLHFAIVSFMPLPPEIAKDSLGTESEQGELQQSHEQYPQNALVDEADIGGILGLIDDPVMRHALEFRLEQRIDQLRIPLQYLRPR